MSPQELPASSELNSLVLQERALCVCNGGNVRSSQMARMLKKNGYEALNCAWKPKFIRTDTLVELCSWADVIFVADERVTEDLVERLNNVWPQLTDWLKSKISTDLAVGKDVWGHPTHPDLVKLLSERIKAYQESHSREYIQWEDNSPEA